MATVATKPRRRAPKPTRPTCTARSKQSGKPCRQRPAAGRTVCRFHGGEAPQVKLAAKLRLAAMVDPALTLLESFLSPAAPVEGEPYIVPDAKLLTKIAMNILDRNGFKAPTVIKVQRAIDVSALSDEDLAAALALSRKLLPPLPVDEA
jgi:hypothetical protein